MQNSPIFVPTKGLTTLTLSVQSDIYLRQCTIQADVNIRSGTTGSSEIIIQGRID